jgi:hypothetical protein
MRHAMLAAATALALCLAGAASADQKTIADPAERNAYAAALSMKDPAAKAQALEAFLKTYPASVVRVDALDQAMAAYQQAGDVAHVQDAARRILAIDAGNVRALAIVVVFDRQSATAATSPARAIALADQAGSEAERGAAALVAWTAPEGVTDADFAAVKAQMSSIFGGALGFRSLEHKDYPAARSFYALALTAHSDDLQNAYQMSIAELEASPPTVEGFWWGAHASNLAAGNAAAQSAILKYEVAKYRHYHGSEDGWSAILTQASAAALTPPAGFSVKPAPTPAELAVQAVAENDPNSLSFSDKIFILGLRDASPENHAAADKVWASILALQGSKRLQIPVKVVALTPDGLYVAISEDAQASNTTEMHVVLEGGPATLPAPGAMIKVTGVLTGYTPKPFRFQMDKGSVQP